MTRRTPGEIAITLAALLMTKTPRVVPVGLFFMPIALISVADGSQSSVYGKFCFVLKLELDFGVSVDKP